VLIGLLQKDYCPPIDSSLFSAIVSDYDLSKSASLQELRTTLDTLKRSALAEENATFDPSRSNGLQYESSSQGSSERARSWHGDSVSVGTEGTELTGLSQALGSVDLHGNAKGEAIDLERERHEAEIEALSPEEKAAILKEMFPNAKQFDIAYTLKKTQNSFGRTVEELLNQEFLEGERLYGKEFHKKMGIDAFTEPTISGRGRRGRKKQRQLLRRTSSTPAPAAEVSSNSSAPRSRWEHAKEDVDFICQRTHVSPQVITSIYHRNDASLPATITAICASKDPDLNPNPYLTMSSPSIIEGHVSELAVDFQHISYSQLKALIALTHPSTASAHELAYAMTSQPTSKPANIVPQYLPRPPSPTSASTPSKFADSSLPFAHSTPNALAISRSNAYTQAQSAHRKSKSNHLMGGAAAYYSSVGRDASASLRRHEAAAADSLVTSQSKPGEVDLHGVTVKDAVSITRARIETWWEREGREWSRQGKVMGGGLRVITGAGRHSEGGKGKLGPAVGGMLVKEGWKVEIGDGVVEVVGRARN